MPIFTGADLREDRRIQCDLCVVGSGAGGSVVAQRASAAGLAVVVLEEGGFHTSDSFDMTEANMNRLLYQEAGARRTADGAIQIVQGRSVGGSTVVNWTTCFRTPEHTFEHWAERFGVEGLSHAALVPHWEQLERQLNVQQAKLAEVNRNNMVTWRGAGALGWHQGLLYRNIKRCAHTGYCGMGCPIDAKQSMLVTMIPEAVRAGADVYANAWVDKLAGDGGKVRGVVARMRDPETDQPNGVTLEVEARTTVLAGGGINSPALLLRSGLNRKGLVGQRTFLHPAVGSFGIHEEAIEPYTGAPQYVYSDQFARRDAGMGFLLEGAPLFPMGLGGFVHSFGADKRAMMGQLKNMSLTAALLHDGFGDALGDPGGSVTLHTDGSPRLDYPFGSRLQEGLKEATRRTLHVQLAGGAREVYTGHGVSARSIDEADRLVERLSFDSCDLPVFSAHVMGGCPMGADPMTSIVDPRSMKHHGLSNLYIVDGSVFPTSLGVNPQMTIYGIASWASEQIIAATRPS